VIGGYTIGGRHFDALIFGYWEGDRLMYAARTRSWVHTGRAGAVGAVVLGAGDSRVSVREPAGGTRRVGRKPDRGEDEKLPVAEAGARRAVRVCGVDAGQALEACGVVSVPK